MVIHTIASSPSGNPCGRVVTVNDIVRGWQNAGRQASSHYLVDRDGTITQMVREANVAFHAELENPNSIGIEHADICNKPDAYTTTLYERSAELVRDIARRNGFNLQVFRFDTPTLANATVVGHVDVGAHGDPGVFWDWEYYAQLLRWNGNASTRPIRLVAVSPPAPAPAGWQSRTRVQVQGETRACIPNEHCAVNRHSWGDTYLRARASTAGTDILFRFDVPVQGRYKVSLWWPRHAGACSATHVDFEALKAGGPARGWVFFDQRRNFGKWNDLGSPYTFTVPASGAQVTVRVHRASTATGWILADAARILRVF